MKEEKIYFSKENITCFACGEKVEKDTEVCPYCGVNLNHNSQTTEST